jgi:Lon protease-like protein
MSSAVQSATHELPLFPLKTVLFPGGPLQLRIFEPRYLDMVARCLRGANRFGVVAIQQGAEVGVATWHEVGTAAEIVDWHQESGGLLGVVAMGRETFRVQQSSRQTDGLYVGEVAWLPPLPPIALPAEHAPLAALLRTVLEPLSAYRELPTAYDDAVWVGCRLAETLPLALPVRQALLETEDALARLEQLAAALRSVEGGG